MFMNHCPFLHCPPRPDIVRFLKSFQAVDGAFGADVKIRLFTVPAFDEKQAKIEFARVNHNKYMVSLIAGNVFLSFPYPFPIPIHSKIQIPIKFKFRGTGGERHIACRLRRIGS